MNSLTFNVERKGTAALVHCRGHLVAGVGSEFAAKIRTLIPENKRIILDLTDLTRVDSMGLGTLVRFTSRPNRAAPASNSSISANRFASCSASRICSGSSAICAKKACLMKF